MLGRPVRPGYLRIHIQFAPGRPVPTPGELSQRAGVDLDLVGAIEVGTGEATVEVAVEAGRKAFSALAALGATAVVDWHWRWLRLGVGRNHGLSLGQLKKLLDAADAGRLGRIHLNNTHSLVGIQDYRLPPLVERLTGARINGYAIRPEALAAGEGPGSPAFTG